MEEDEQERGEINILPWMVMTMITMMTLAERWIMRGVDEISRV